MFVLNQLDKTLSVIDGTAGNSTIPLGATPTAVVVSPDGSRAYVTLLGPPVPGGGRYQQRSDRQKHDGRGQPGGVAMTADGRRVYVTNGGSNTCR